MSRIGRKAIIIPSAVKLDIATDKITVTGPKGQLFVPVQGKVKAVLEGDKLSFSRSADDKATRALHGLARSLAQNAVDGVTTGFVKDLELVGTGYRVAATGSNLTLSLGFSHPIVFKAVPGITLAVEGQTKIKISGIDKQLVGQVAANIRKLKQPEPYKGKGIRYSDEVIRRKAGKAAAKGAA